MFVESYIKEVDNDGIIIKFNNSQNLGFIHKYDLKSILRNKFPNNIIIGGNINVRNTGIIDRKTNYLRYTQSKEYKIGEIVSLTLTMKFDMYNIYESDENISYKISKNRGRNSGIKHHTLRKLYEFYVSGIGQFGNPLFLWKKYKTGSTVKLSFDRSAEEFNIFIDDNGDKQFIRRNNWEIGPKYHPPNSGDIIPFKVSHYTSKFYPIFEQVNLINPYFISIEELLKDKSYKDGFFNIDNLDNNSISIKEKKMYSDYINKNANWIFSYSVHINNLYKLAIGSIDFMKALNLLRILCAIEEYILHSGFLLTYNEKKRKISAEYAEDVNLKCRRRIKVLTIITTNKIDKFVTKIKKQLEEYDKTKKDKHIEEFEYFSMLTNFASYLVTNNQFEELVNLAKKRNILYQSMSIATLYNRKKLLRTKLLSKSAYGTIKNLERNEDLKHIIYLLDIEKGYLIRESNVPEKVFIESELLKFKAYYIQRNSDKKKYLDKAINVLNDYIPLRKYFDNEKDIVRWSRDKNVQLGLIYEYLATISNTNDDTIRNLKIAYDYFKRGLATRGYYIKYFYEYFNVMNRYLQTKNIEKLLSEVKLLFQELRNDRKKWLTRFPSLRSLLDITETLSIIGNDDSDAIEYLYKRSISVAKTDIELPNRKYLSRLVLANNLIYSVSGRKYFIKELIFEYIEKGLLELKQNIVPFVADSGKNAALTHEIYSEEISNIELKGSFYLHIKNYCDTAKLTKSKKVKDSFLKAVCGMLNADGGNIYIGVLEEEDYFNLEKSKKRLDELNAVKINNRIIVGVEPELTLLKSTKDKHTRHIAQILRMHISDDVMAFINLEFENICGRTIYKYKIRSYTRDTGAWVNFEKDSIKRFFLRENNETIEKTIEQWTQWYATKHKSNK